MKTSHFLAHLAARPTLLAQAVVGRSLALFNSSYLRHRGAYASFEEAAASVRKGALVGYNHDAVVLHSFEFMSELKLEDYPVLYWLKSVMPQNGIILDAGGHMGTKYRAFRSHLDLDGAIQWVIYDLPAIVNAGRELAARDGLSKLVFIDKIADAPKADVLLASGLLQYLDVPFDLFLKRLPSMPRHLLLNKVQTREGPSIFTLENFGCAEVPYQIRNRTEFLASLEGVGYEIVDEWTIPALSRRIHTHPRLGRSSSRGYYARLRDR